MRNQSNFKTTYFPCRLFLLALAFTFVFAAENGALHRTIVSLKNSPALRHAQWGLYAEYCDNGQVIIDYNGRQSLAPASGLKLFTGAAALDALGENFRFETRLYFDGRLSGDGLLEGNVYIRGGGDPTLGSDRVRPALNLDDLLDSWADALSAKGIRVVDGNIFADGNLVRGWPVQAKWYWEDLGNYYGAGPGGLCINENLYRLVLRPGKQPGDAVSVIRTEPPVEGLVFDNRLTTGPAGSGDQAYIFCAPGSYHAVLLGSVPAGKSRFVIKGSLPDPPLLAARLLLEKLKRRGIRCAGTAQTVRQSPDYPAMELVHTTHSPPLKDIVFMLSKRSVNLYAEQLAVNLARQNTDEPSTVNGAKAILNFLAEMDVDTAGIRLYDASGLSRSDRITARAMVKLLSAMTRHKYFSSFYRSLAVAGDPEDAGDLRSFGRGTRLADNARIKTGLLTAVRSHSGYVIDRSGRRIAFCFIANNYRGGYKQIDALHEKLLLRLTATIE